MSSKRPLLAAAAFTAILFLFSCTKESLSPDLSSSKVDLAQGRHREKCGTTSMRVFAKGLNNPRGLKFGPDGKLYVAEGGKGGSQTTSCIQVIPPIGPYTGSQTGGGISRIDAWGNVDRFMENLPSSQTNAGSGGLVSGVADIAWVGKTLYALLAGAGCSHGVNGIPNGIVRVRHDGSWKLIADLSSWQQAHPVQNPEPDDFEPDGSWYSMLEVEGDLYALEPNHGELLKVTTEGHIRRVIDISASQGHVVPTAMIYRGGFLIGNLHPFPIVDGQSNVWKVSMGGQIQLKVQGLTTVLGLEMDKEGRLYVLENTTGQQFPTPGTGKIIRIDHSGKLVTIASGFNLPTAMTFGPDGKLYVSNWGFGPPAAGGGEIIQVDVKDCECEEHALEN